MFMILYHGTTEQKAIGIPADGFQQSIGEQHSLGSGIYLYSDVYQALHWAKMKADYLTRRSGEEHRPAVIEVGIEVDEGRYKRETMNKYERWNKMSEEYFEKVTDEKLIKDSARVGIILLKREKTIRTVHKPSTARVSRNFWKCTRANAAGL